MTALRCVREITTATDGPPAPRNKDDLKPAERLDDEVVGEPAEKEALDAAIKELLNCFTRGSSGSGTSEGPCYDLLQLETKEPVKKVQQALVQMGVKVWFDKVEMHGSTIARMAHRIECSQAIVMCYSQEYKNSNS